MYDLNPAPRETLPSCAVCGAPARHPLFAVRLCDACSARYTDEAPPLASLELAHADAHPVDVAQRGEYRYLAEGQTERRWVTLRPGITEGIARAHAASWVLRVRARAA